MTIKKFYLKTLSSILLFLIALFTFGADNTIVNSFDIISTRGLSTTPMNVVLLTGKEEIKTPYDELLNKTEYVPINEISQPIFFPKDLFVTEYKDLIIEKLENEYPKAFKNEAINDFFFKALSEYTYSMNGRLDPSFFNKVIEGRKQYFKVRDFIDTLKMYRLTKISIQYLIVDGFIYKHTLKSAKEAIENLKKLPNYPLLYIVNPPKVLLPRDKEGKIITSSIAAPQSVIDPDVDYSAKEDEFGNTLYGDYINFGMGENLYYICASIYPEFVNLPGAARMKILNSINDFNITVTTSRPVKADNTLWSYLQEQFNNIDRDPFLKYRLNLKNSWLFLPNSLKPYTNKDKK